MKRIIYFAASLLLTVSSSLLIYSASVAASWNPNIIIDDVVFDDSGTMSATSIQDFLNSFPSSCLKNYSAPYPNGYESYGGNVSAATVIRRAADIYGINPQVILVTLEKEESLVSGSAGCDGWRYNSAMGMACPDGGSCPAPGYEGFSKQVTKGTWLLKFGKERSNGNIGWVANDGVGGDPAVYYGGPMTQGWRQRVSGGDNQYYDGYWTIDGQTVHIDSGATGSLYNYTPHFHGNQNFVSLFESWFGSTISGEFYSCVPNGANIEGEGSGEKIFGNRRGTGPELFSAGALNQTGTGCVEVHTATNNLQSWLKHTATNWPSVNPADNDILAADITGNNIDELYLVGYRNTGSNKIEFHRWDKTYQHWVAHIASISTTNDPAASDIISADLDGNGRDEVLLILYTGTNSGKIEVHGWTHDFQGWFLHAATNQTALSKAQNRVIAADYDGNGKDELLLVNYQGTNSGKIEVHGWTPDFQGWFLHAATNHTTSNPANGLVTAANYNGIGRDELFIVLYQNTGSGRKEVHGWTFNLQEWFLHAALP